MGVITNLNINDVCANIDRDDAVDAEITFDLTRGGKTVGMVAEITIGCDHNGWNLSCWPSADHWLSGACLANLTDDEVEALHEAIEADLDTDACDDAVA